MVYLVNIDTLFNTRPSIRAHRASRGDGQETGANSRDYRKTRDCLEGDCAVSLEP